MDSPLTNVVFNRNQYGTDKSWVGEDMTSVVYSGNQNRDKSWTSEKKEKDFIYPLIHSTTKTQGIKYRYTNTKSPPVRNHIEMFGYPKVIFGQSGIFNAVIDMEGKYGMTDCAMAIKVDDLEMATELKKYIEGEEFKNILDACSWGNFRIDWRMFNYFKKDFYKI
jgi:hypothetical protein